MYIYAPVRSSCPILLSYLVCVPVMPLEAEDMTYDDLKEYTYIYIYMYAYLKNFIQLGHKKQNILHMHSEKLNNAINGSMSFSQ